MRRFFALSLATILAAYSPTAVSAGEIEVGGAGSVSHLPGMLTEKVRQDGIQRALEDALLRAVTQSITETQLMAHQQTITRDLLPIASSMATTYAVQSEQKSLRQHTVVLAATFDEDKLRSNLEGLGISMDVRSRRSVAVVIDEYFSVDLPPTTEPMVQKVTERTTTQSRGQVEMPGYMMGGEGDSIQSAILAAQTGASSGANIEGGGGDAMGLLPSSYTDPGSDISTYFQSQREKKFEEKVVEYFPPAVIERPRANPSSAAGITAHLLDRDVRVIDSTRIASIRTSILGDSGLLASVVADPATLSRRTAKAGAMADSDAVLVGTTAIIYMGTSGTKHKCEASLTARIVDTSTGDILATISETEVGLANSSEGAAEAAGKRLGDAVGEVLSAQLVDYYRKREAKGSEVTVTIVGVTSTANALKLTDLLGTVRGADDVQQRLFDRSSGLLVLTLTTTGKLAEVKMDALRTFYKDPALQGLEEETSLGAAWRFSLPQ